MQEHAELRFATSGNQPLIVAAPYNPFVWEWGLPCEIVDEFPPDQKNPKERLPTEMTQRGAPDMARAARALKGTPFPLQRQTASHYARFWALTQAAAPAEYLPRRARRSLDRDSVKTPKSRPRMGSLWVVDLPRPKPDTAPGEEPVGTGRKHSYRYPVRGHWREQWYPTVQTYKHIWINEHTRGPDSGPFYDRRKRWEREHRSFLDRWLFLSRRSERS